MDGFDLRNLLNPENWLAMDENGSWYLYAQKPVNTGWCWSVKGGHVYLDSDFFNFPEIEHWVDSLIQVKDLVKD